MNAPNSLRALLDKQGRGIGGAPPPAKEPDEEYEPFASGRIGNRPQLTLVFRKADHSVHALAYSYLYSITSDNPGMGFALDFTHAKVEIKGRNLERLFQLVCQHRAMEIIEAGRSDDFVTPASEPLVARIEIKCGAMRSSESE